MMISYQDRFRKERIFHHAWQCACGSSIGWFIGYWIGQRIASPVARFHSLHDAILFLVIGLFDAIGILFVPLLVMLKHKVKFGSFHFHSAYKKIGIKAFFTGMAFYLAGLIAASIGEGTPFSVVQYALIAVLTSLTWLILSIYLDSDHPGILTRMHRHAIITIAILMTEVVWQVGGDVLSFLHLKGGLLFVGSVVTYGITGITGFTLGGAMGAAVCRGPRKSRKLELV